jgi:hypothetical protein
MALVDKKMVVTTYRTRKAKEGQKVTMPPVTLPETDNTVNVKELGPDWIEYSKDYFNAPKDNEEPLRKDKRTSTTEQLPYLSAHTTVPKSCPGFSYNEWLGYIQNIMVFIITHSFTSESMYLTQLLREGDNASDVAKNKYYHAVVLTNKYVQEFQQSKGNTTPTNSIAFMRLFRIIAMATITNCNFGLEQDECPPIEDVPKQVSNLLTTWGTGTFQPMAEVNSIISLDGYLVFPLQTAVTKKRQALKFLVSIILCKSSCIPNKKRNAFTLRIIINFCCGDMNMNPEHSSLIHYLFSYF